MNLEYHNFHWRKGYFYGYEMKREIYPELWKSLKSRRITVITGTRRVGKTTIMKQMMDELIKSGTGRYEILYFSFDEEQPPIMELIKEYEARLGVEILESGKRYHIFLDEIQKLDGWQGQIKRIYDSYENIKFVVSGSASLFIRQGVRESLAGRVKEFHMGPLSFREYLRFTGKDYMMEKPEMFEKDLESEFERYLKRQYIEVLNEDDDEVRDYVRSIIEKVVFIDIPQIFSIENPHLLMKIVEIVASEPGMLMDYSSLARAIGDGESISRVRASRYVHHLQDSYLLKLGYNYSESGMVSERKMKKAYLANASLSMISRKEPDMGRLAEQSFFMADSVRFFWRTPQKDEVDIILEEEKGPIPVEVKYQNTIGKGDMKGLLKFMKRYGVKKGILISKSLKDTVETERGVIDVVPAWKFALEN